MRIGRVKLVEEAIGFIENKNVAIAGAGIRVALDGSGERNGHGAGIAFARRRLIVEGMKRLRGIDDGIGNAHAGTVVLTGAEIGMKSDGGADVINDGGGVGVDGGGGDVFIPEIVGGERKEAAEAGALAGGHLRAAGSLHRTIDLEIERRKKCCRGRDFLR